VSSAEDYIRNKLSERSAAGNYRMLKPENLLIDFCSNDYLGFARSIKLKQLIAQELQRLGKPLNGSTGSRLITGNTIYAEQLEGAIADFHDSEAALLFNSGYDANLGLLSSLPQRGDTVITDELIHASVIDGIRMSNANRYTFKHNDLNGLEDKLKNAKGICYVVVESVYSMDGDTAPITAILELTEKYHASLIVDEAHATGVFGKGLVNNLGLYDRIFARVITFGKALGCHGAVVLGSTQLRNYLINFSRSFIYTTAAPMHQLAAIKMAYQLLRNSSTAIDQLKGSINLFKKGLMLATPSTLIDSDSAIHCLLMKSNDKAKSTAAELQAKGFDVRPIMSPTVAAGSERLRICLHAYNTQQEIEMLTDTINKLMNHA
jgi:8-amino-7-oxononanoate synthase